jgi:hypothetical protein
MRRPRLSAAERAELWTRWKQGEPLSDIAMTLDRAPGTVYARNRKAGRIPERPRQRAARALNVVERAGGDIPGAGGGADGTDERPGAGSCPVER